MGKALIFIALGGIAFYGLTSFTHFKTNKEVTLAPLVIEQKESIVDTILPTATSTSENVLGTSTDALVPAVSTTTLVTHRKTPEVVKALYMTSWIVGTKNAREKMLSSVKKTGINTYIIDVKDNTGVVSWDGRVKKDDLRDVIARLHEEGYYVIARVTAFQDPLFAKAHPSEAIKRTDGSVWKTKKGEAWVDPGSRLMWDYLISLGKESYALGFDEINYDYIRFSTDGLKEKLVFPQSKDRGVSGREAVIEEFYAYVTEALRAESIPVSGDVFGIITTSTGDVAVLGQNFETALKHFDYVAPMVYPSHYAAGTFGYQNPAAHPGPVITESLLGAIRLADSVASSTGQATSTVRAKIRPWYQDFNMGAVYTASLVKAQIDAGNKLGVTSYMMWDPGNTYTLEAYK